MTGCRLIPERVRLFVPSEVGQMLDRCCCDVAPRRPVGAGGPPPAKPPRTIFIIARRQ